MAIKRMQGDYEFFVPYNLKDIKINHNNEIDALINKAYLLLGRLDGMAMTLPDIDLFVSMYVQKRLLLVRKLKVHKLP